MTTMMHVKTGADKQRSYDGDYMERGKEAEEIVIEFLKRQPDVIGILDWRQLKVVREADVDIAIKSIDGRVTLAEIKSDSHLGITPNVLFEVLRINHTCHPENCLTLGWAGRTPAQHIIFYAHSIKKIYIARFNEFRKAFQKYTMDARAGMHEKNIKVVATDNIKTTINILIPFSYCKSIFTIYDPFENEAPF